MFGNDYMKKHNADLVIDEIKYLSDYTLYIKFSDNISGKINISKVIPFEGIFEKLKEKDYFSSVKLNKELGSISWDNGADIATDFLYEKIEQ